MNIIVVMRSHSQPLEFPEEQIMRILAVLASFFLQNLSEISFAKSETTSPRLAQSKDPAKRMFKRRIRYHSPKNRFPYLRPGEAPRLRKKDFFKLYEASPGCTQLRFDRVQNLMTLQKSFSKCTIASECMEINPIDGSYRLCSNNGG